MSAFSCQGGEAGQLDHLVQGELACLQRFRYMREALEGVGGSNPAGGGPVGDAQASRQRLGHVAAAVGSAHLTAIELGDLAQQRSLVG